MDREPKNLAGDDDPLALDLEELLALTAHELHEPLRKISAFGELLKERSGHALDDEGLDYLARIERATERMRTTLTRVISFGASRRGEERGRTSPVYISGRTRSKRLDRGAFVCNGARRRGDRVAEGA